MPQIAQDQKIWYSKFLSVMYFCESLQSRKMVNPKWCKQALNLNDVLALPAQYRVV